MKKKMRHSIQSDHSYRIFTGNAITLLLIKSFLDLLNGTESIMSPNTSDSIVVYARPLHITPIKTCRISSRCERRLQPFLRIRRWVGVEHRFRCQADSFAVMLRFKTHIKPGTHSKQTQSDKSNKNEYLQSLIYVPLHILHTTLLHQLHIHILRLGFMNEL